MKNVVISQVKVSSAAANPLQLHSASLQSILAVGVIIPPDLRIIARLSFQPCHYVAHKCQFLSKRALPLPRPGALWKYDSHAARHMWPPTLLWDIDPLFIEVARPVTLDSAQTFSFDREPPLWKSSVQTGLAGEGGRVFLGGGRRGRLERRQRET